MADKNQANQVLAEMLSAALKGEVWERKGFTDWEEVLECAGHHAVIPLVADSLRSLPEAAERVSEACRLTVLQNYHLMFTTKYVVNVLREAGIETVVLKGVSAACYYAQPELRKSGDVDVQLLDPSRIEEAERCLLQKGFHTMERQIANHHLSMLSPEGIELELHSMLVEPFDDENINRYLERLVTQIRSCVELREIMGVEFPVLSDGMQAYQLLVHMLQHFLRSGFGMRLLCDWVVFWNRAVEEGECARYRLLVEESGLEGFSKMITSVCVYRLGLRPEVNGWLCRDLFSREDADLFWEDVLDAEEFGKSSEERMVLLKGSRLTDYLREFHHQMHLNFPRAGRWFILFPALWLATLVRFLRNNRTVRGVTARQVLQAARRRSRRIEQIGLFGKGKRKKK